MSCDRPGALERVMDWLHQPEPETELHLFECEACAATAATLLELADGVRAVVREGGVQMGLSRRLLASLEAARVKVQAFELAEGQAIPCSAEHDRGLIVLRLPLEPEGPVGLTMLLEGTVLARFEDVAFTPGAGEVLLGAPARAWASVPEASLTFRLGDRRGDHDFVMLHRPAAAP